VAKQLFSNGASATLAVSIINTDVTVQVQSGYGVLFPSPTGGDYFVLTLEDNLANVEVMHCTARSGDLLTVTRAQEGTPAQAFTNTVTRCELRNTKGTLERMLQRNGDTLGGNLELGGHTLSGPGAIGTDVTFPLTLAFSVGMIMLWSGSIGTIPTGWHLCDGTAGTPNLRDRFIVGAGSAYAVGATGGATTDAITTSVGGGHDHGAATGSHALTTAEMPAHTHEVGARGSNASSNSEPKDFIDDYPGSGSNVVSSSTGGGAGHTHTITAEPNHSHTATVDTVPPYYALAYIMFTG
jgi:hypothetical protein